VHELVLDGICRPDDLGTFEPGDRSHKLPLELHGQAVAQARCIDLPGVDALGFDDDRMAATIAEPHHLVLKGRAVAGRGPGDGTRVEGAQADVAPDDIVGLR